MIVADMLIFHQAIPNISWPSNKSINDYVLPITLQAFNSKLPTIVCIPAKLTPHSGETDPSLFEVIDCLTDG